MLLLLRLDPLLAITMDFSPVKIKVLSQLEGLVTVLTAEEFLLLMQAVHVPGEVTPLGEGEPAGPALVRATSLVDSPLVLEEVAGSGEDYVIPLLGAGLALPLVG